MIPEFGLIWIDAHMDAHTLDTSPSGNLHGVPVATLLGFGDSRLMNSATSPVLKPEQIVLLGIRSYEPQERKLLNTLKVRYYDIDEIRERSFSTCFKEAVDHLSPLRFGISFDLDGLDPRDIVSVGTPVPQGIRLKDVLTSFENHLDRDALIGFELVEYNPD